MTPLPRPRSALWLLPLLAMACSDAITAADCDCPVDTRCLDGVCVPVNPPPSDATGLYTRVAPLPDGVIVAATHEATRSSLRLVFFDQDGHELTRYALAAATAGADAPPARTIDDDGGLWPSIATTGERVHVIWHDRRQGRLLHASGDLRRGFSPPTVVDGDGPEVVGTYTDLAIARDGTLHAVYRDETRRRLRHATRTPDGAWSRADLPGCAGERSCPVPRQEDYGEFASLVLLPESGGIDSPRVAFYDRLRGDLKLAAPDRDREGGWRVTTLDGRDLQSGQDTGDVGRFASLAVTPARNLALVYFDDSRGALRMMTPGSAPRTLDDGAFTAADGRRLQRVVGQFARLRIDAEGQGHVIYFDATRLRWHYLRTAGEAITDRTLLTALRPGGWLDFTIDEGTLRGAYGALVDGDTLGTELRHFTHEAPR